MHDLSFRSQFVRRIRPPDKGTDIRGAHERLPYGIDAVVRVLEAEQVVILSVQARCHLRIVLWAESFANHVLPMLDVNEEVNRGLKGHTKQCKW